MLSDKTIQRLRTQTVEEIWGQKHVSGSFGVELELEGDRFPEAVPMWNVHQEGSIRGREFVTDGGVNAKELGMCLDFLLESFKHAKTRPQKSYRAGTHIHFNMQKRTLDDVFRSMISFSMVEPVFLKLCGNQRDGNLFCLPSYDTGDMATWLDMMFKVIKRGNVPKFTRGKYASLNSDTIPRFGTLEARCFPCSWDKDEILRWAELLQTVLTPKVSPGRLLSMANLSPKTYLDLVFKDWELPEDKLSLLGFGVEQTFQMVDIYKDNMGDT